MERNLSELGKQLQEYLLSYGGNILGAILIIVIVRIIARICRDALRKTMLRVKMDDTAAGFFSSFAYWALVSIAVIAALSKLGVETASFVALIGALSFAVGMALQNSLGNFAAGIMILLFRPFRVGDTIEAGTVTGKVVEIELFATVLRGAENVKIIIPNGKLYGDIIKNHSGFDKV